jgi:TRAP-type C4-dicarboxylate transport system permease small subunit
MAVLMLAMVGINFANVVGRKLFGQAVFWSEEVMLFMLIWAVFLGAVVITYDGKHLRMDLFSTRLRRPWSTMLNAVTAALFVAVAGFMIMQSQKVVLMMASTGQVSNAAHIPMIVLHLSVLIGFVAMVLAVLVRWRAYITGDFDR